MALTVPPPTARQIQATLFGIRPFALGDPARGLSEARLDEACRILHRPHWVDGADDLFLDLLASLPWRTHRRWMVDHEVLEPRLSTSLETPTAEMAARPVDEWLRTYRDHERGGTPVDAPGGQDVTAEVAVDQLAPGATACTQADFLRTHGIDALVEVGRRQWEERAHLGDLEALKARSRIAESEALLEPSGLGGFTVLEWPVGGS